MIRKQPEEIEMMQGINPVKIRKRNLPIYWIVKFISGKDIKFLQFGVSTRIK